MPELRPKESALHEVTYSEARHQHAPPYPDPDNPILAGLIARARDMARNESVEAAIPYLAVRAWTEGHLEGRDYDCSTETP